MVAAQTAAILRAEDASRQRLSRLERELNEAEAELRDARTKRESHEAEIKTPMTQTLSDAEIQELEQLRAQLEEQKTALQEATERRQEVSCLLRCYAPSIDAYDQISSERSALEIELNDGLRRTRLRLRGDLDELEGDAGAGVLQSGEIELRSQELKNIIRSIENLSEQISGE